MQKEPITKFGYNKLNSEYEFLRKQERPQTVIELDIARSHGDLKENAEYHAAKEKLAHIDARVGELGNLITKVQVVDPSTYPHDRVKFGSTVKLEDLETSEEIEYTIVGAFESFPELGYISIKTPIAKALVGKKKGDEVKVKLPIGEEDFEILDVYFKPIKLDNVK